MDKLLEIFAGLSKKEDRKYNKYVIIFAVIGIAAVAGLIIYAVWRFMQPEYLDGYDDEDEDDEDDDTE
ncbi:MAG TPA: hypothetical protein DCQ39_06645 [Lachnospiraceae bacterium]|nr:hypothetical protein [Lachnospiraceae bacterium]